MSSGQDSGITVEKTLHMENAHVTSISYTSTQGRSLIESVRTPEGRAEIRVSHDNGQNWHKQADWPISLGIEGGVEHLASEPHYYLDPDHDCLMEFVTHYDTRVGEVLDFGPEAARDPLELRTKKLYYRVSGDGGQSWGPRQQVIQDGYDSEHWCAYVQWGVNSGDIGPLRIVKNAEGLLVMPLWIFCLGADGKLEKLPDRFGDVLWADESQACFLGRWREDLSGLDWDISNEVRVPEFMSFGVTEGTVAPVAKGQLMMVLRGCAAGRQALPGVKFFCISPDGGRTWGPAVPLTYPDGTYVNSPASLPWLFRSAKNDRVYLIANILDRPTRQSDPRHPLQIAEVDAEYFWVKPETITVIADREPQHPQFVRFSNWAQIEDRETGKLRLYMTEARIDALFNDPGEVSPHAWCYEIDLPEGP